MTGTAARLAAQEIGSAPQEAGSNANVRARSFTLTLPVGKWTKILDANKARRLLEIHNLGGDNGPGRVMIAMDGTDKGMGYNIDRFAPNLAPINLIYAFAESNYGDTAISVQVVEG